MHLKNLPKARLGFTLIELMIAVAIIGILAAIAIPQYRDYVTRGRLADGVSGLSTVRAQMERHFQDNRTYNSVTGFTSPCLASPSPVFGNFTISCTATPTATAFTLQAVGGGPVNGFTFTVNQTGVQATSASPWTTCTSKWILKKGEAC
jgi:type IV pilus assembly protein PilE